MIGDFFGEYVRHYDPVAAFRTFVTTQELGAVQNTILFAKQNNFVTLPNPPPQQIISKNRVLILSSTFTNGTSLPNTLPIPGGRQQVLVTEVENRMPAPGGGFDYVPVSLTITSGIFVGGKIVNFTIPATAPPPPVGNGPAFDVNLHGTLVFPNLPVVFNPATLQVLVNQAGLVFRQVPVIEANDVRGDFKIAQNESPRPADRVFVNYNYFDNIPGQGSSLDPVDLTTSSTTIAASGVATLVTNHLTLAGAPRREGPSRTRTPR